MAKGKAKVKKQKRTRDPELQAMGGSKKGMNLAGKGKRVATGPPGTPNGAHHIVMAKEGICFCGRCSNERLTTA